MITHLHRVELATAWRLKVFRGEIPPDVANRAEADLLHDIAAGVWASPSYVLSSVFDRAEALARSHSSSIGTRTLDALHVAAALELRTRSFVTADRRQAKLARAAGLRVTSLR